MHTFVVVVVVKLLVLGNVVLLWYVAKTTYKVKWYSMWHQASLAIVYFWKVSQWITFCMHPCMSRQYKHQVVASNVACFNEDPMKQTNPNTDR